MLRGLGMDWSLYLPVPLELFQVPASANQRLRVNPSLFPRQAGSKPL